MNHLSKELNNFLVKKVKTSDFLSVDYPTIDSTKQSQLNHHKVRGSVRLLFKRVLTPFDVQKLLDKVLSIKLP